MLFLFLGFRCINIDNLKRQWKIKIYIYIFLGASFTTGNMYWTYYTDTRSI